METQPTEIRSSKMFGGFNKRYRHFSSTLGCSMNFHIYFPPPPSPYPKFPSGAQRAASAEGVALIAPDTPPRGLNVEGELDCRDFGVDAGFYLNATQEKWKNWCMYDYVVKELPQLLSENFPQLETSQASIFGHSICRHGALTIYLKNLYKYKGGDDKFLPDQPFPNKFEVYRSAKVPLLRLQPGYDHSYFFIATFNDDHIHHHAQALRL